MTTSSPPTPCSPASQGANWRFPLACTVGAFALWIQSGNQPLFLLLHNLLLENGSANLWANLTMLGDAAICPLILVLYLRRRPDLLWAAVLGGLLTWAITHSLKPWIDAARPPALLDIVVIGPRLLHGSFPSGHSASIFALAGLLMMGLPLRSGWLKAGALVIATLVGLSRIALGVHWPLDVLGGAALGWIGALGGLEWSRHWSWGSTGRGRWLPIGCLALLAGYDLFANRSGLPSATILQHGAPLLALAWGGYELKQSELIARKR